jgi:hypothetical protein
MLVSRRGLGGWEIVSTKITPIAVIEDFPEPPALRPGIDWNPFSTASDAAWKVLAQAGPGPLPGRPFDFMAWIEDNSMAVYAGAAALFALAVMKR